MSQHRATRLAAQSTDRKHLSLVQADDAGELRFADVRMRTVELCRPLDVEDHGVQPMVDASPPKWHLAHTTWFFETFLLQPFAANHTPFHSAFEHLFNSYYEGVGDRHPRAQRGILSRPTLTEVHAYRAHVDDRMAPLLDSDDAEIRARIQLGLHHEQQHQELIVTDIKANFGSNPLRPAYKPATDEPSTDASALAFVEFGGELVEAGAPCEGAFCFDNELPRHKVWLDDFALANRLVTNGEYAEFIAAGGYDDPAFWLADGWVWVRANGVRAPMYWRQEGEGWLEYRLDGEKPLTTEAPVTHVSYFEADAFARWANARLATEIEWEHAAAQASVAGNFANGTFHPRPASGRERMAQLFGDCWEWTASSYGPYPGFRPLAGALGEYNGKFMSGQQVLRGGSCATPPNHIRPTYRNFFYPKDRWQFTGIRLARTITGR